MLEQIPLRRHLADLAKGEGEDNPGNGASIIDIDEEASGGYLLDAVYCGVTPGELGLAVVGAAGFYSREVMGRQQGRFVMLALFGFDRTGSSRPVMSSGGRPACPCCYYGCSGQEPKDDRTFRGEDPCLDARTRAVRRHSRSVPPYCFYVFPA